MSNAVKKKLTSYEVKIHIFTHKKETIVSAYVSFTAMQGAHNDSESSPAK